MEAVLIRDTGWKPESTGKIETNELILEYFANQSIIRPGNHITLVLDIHLKKNMHVYAPGVEGYTPVTWKLNQSELYRGDKPEFPEAEILNMEVIGEKVPVYHRQFRILQDIEFAQKPILNKSLGDISKTPELVMEGTFEYQACDDKTCYIPKTLKLKFTFKVEEHDWKRTKAQRPSQ